MQESLRQKKVSSLIRAALGKILTQNFREIYTGLISITRVEMTKDLRKAYIFISYMDSKNPDDTSQLMSSIQEKNSFLRKAVASNVKLKYNPELIFRVDPTPEIDQNIDRILRSLKTENE